MRPIVSSCATITYNIARELARILKPLVGRSEHHVLNTKAFVDALSNIQLEEGEIIMSYDVSALFTSVPVDQALTLVSELLHLDTTLKDRTDMSPDSITQLLSLCLKGTYFVFQGQYYEQLEGAAMGSPVSPIIANLYMEHFETNALASAPSPPRYWKRYVDDTFVVIQKSKQEEFFQHINNIDPHIKFTAESTRPDGSMPFLDTLVSPQEDGALSVSVFRKPTHTDQYLQWDSHHPLSAKYGVLSTLLHRAKTVCSTEEALQTEKSHLKTALEKCKYPSWAWDKCEKKPATPTVNTVLHTQKEKMKGHTVVPYTKGISETYKNILRKYGFNVYFKAARTIKNSLVAPKDKVENTQKSGVIYHFQCKNLDCDDSYIGEAGRVMKDRLKEHQRAPSPIHHHHLDTGHSLPRGEDIDIVSRESDNQSRLIKESMYIRVNQPTLNRNIGKYQLSHLWDSILLNVQSLKLD